MSPELADWLASMREWARDPKAICHTLQGQSGQVAISPDDVTSRTDSELLEFIRARCAET